MNLYLNKATTDCCFEFNVFNHAQINGAKFPLGAKRIFMQFDEHKYSISLKIAATLLIKKLTLFLRRKTAKYQGFHKKLALFFQQIMVS